jgi:hypothetical protein
MILLGDVFLLNPLPKFSPSDNNVFYCLRIPELSKKYHIFIAISIVTTPPPISVLTSVSQVQCKVHCTQKISEVYHHCLTLQRGKLNTKGI